VISVAAIVCGVVFSISRLEWCAVVLSIGLVWTAELLNTGIERLGDAVTREPNELIRHAKDAAAGGVLVASITAAAVGAIVFLPKVLA
jgi:diacylglycerol kinase